MELRHKLPDGSEFSISEDWFCKAWSQFFPDVFLCTEKATCGICEKYAIQLSPGLPKEVNFVFVFVHFSSLYSGARKNTQTCKRARATC